MLGLVKVQDEISRTTLLLVLVWKDWLLKNAALLNALLRTQPLDFIGFNGSNSVTDATEVHEQILLSHIPELVSASQSVVVTFSSLKQVCHVDVAFVEEVLADGRHGVAVGLGKANEGGLVLLDEHDQGEAVEATQDFVVGGGAELQDALLVLKRVVGGTEDVVRVELQDVLGQGGG